MKLILKAPIKQHRIKIHGRLKLLYIENYTPLIDHFQCALKDIQCLYEKNLGIGIGKNRKSEITGRDTDYPVFLSVILFTFPSSPVCLSSPPAEVPSRFRRTIGQSAAATAPFLRKMDKGKNIMQGQNPFDHRPNLHHRRAADERHPSVAAVLPYSANGRSAQQYLFNAPARKFLTGCGAVRL